MPTAKGYRDWRSGERDTTLQLATKVSFLAPACSPRPQVEEFLLDGERDGGSRAVGWQE